MAENSAPACARARTPAKPAGDGLTVIDGDHLTFRKWVRQLVIPVLVIVGVLLLAGALSAWSRLD